MLELPGSAVASTPTLQKQTGGRPREVEKVALERAFSSGLSAAGKITQRVR